MVQAMGVEGVMSEAGSSARQGSSQPNGSSVSSVYCKYCNKVSWYSTLDWSKISTSIAICKGLSIGEQCNL